MSQKDLVANPTSKEIFDEPICQKGEDLFRRRARQTIFRLIPDFFVQNKVTVIEAMHRADVLGKLENSGSFLQHAVQKIAITQSSANGISVPETIKIFNRLVDELYSRVFNDKQNNVFPEVPAEGFGALAAKLASRKDGAYVLNGAIARFLRDGANWNEKTVRLARLAELNQQDGPGRCLLYEAIDDFLAEILCIPAALHDIIGAKELYGDTLLALLGLFLGKEQTGQYGEGQGLARLARRFAANELPLAHASLAASIVAEIYSLKRLRSDSVDAEMKMFRQVANLAEQCVGEHMPREKLMPALELRAQRFVDPDCMNACLAASILPDEKLEWLFFAESCIIGAHNRNKIFEAAVRAATSAAFNNRFESTQIPTMKRLHRLAVLNALALRSGFADEMKRKIANIIDIKACDIAGKSRLFESIESKPAPSAEKAIMLIKLFAAGAFTEHRLATKARDAIMTYAAQPGFIAGYIDQKLRSSGDELDNQTATAELMDLLHKIGIPSEKCLKALAA
jgi:hypothetical protein